MSTRAARRPELVEPHRRGQRLGQRQLGQRRVRQPAQVVQDRLGGVARLEVEVDRGLGVLALGELAPRAPLLLHQRRDVGVVDLLEAERGEQLQVRRHRGEPLVAAHHQRGPHQVVVHGVREVVGRQPRLGGRGLEDHHVVAVVLGLHAPAEASVNATRSADLARRAEPHHVRVAGLEPPAHVGVGRVAPRRPPAVVAGRQLERPLRLGDLGELLLGGEVRGRPCPWRISSRTKVR